MLFRSKHVIVIGGGDTGSDCVGTSTRHGAVSVTQFEVMPMPPEKENKAMVWPYWPLKLRTSSSHDESADKGLLKREFSISTQAFVGKNGKERPTRITDAREKGYVPSVTTITKVMAVLKSGKALETLNRWATVSQG
mgnify:CR=1 FL=1